MKTRITGGTFSLMNGVFFGALEIYRENAEDDPDILFELELGIRRTQDPSPLLSTTVQSSSAHE